MSHFITDHFFFFTSMPQNNQMMSHTIFQPIEVQKLKESAATTKMNSRYRPLHACGVSVLAIADLAYNRTQDFNGPLGSTLRRVTKLAKFASPLIYAMQYQWLAILSFIDDHILAVENMIEKLFPPSTYVFDKIDQLVRMIESVPEKLDDAVKRFPAIIHQVPLIEWPLVHLISWLNCLISTLNRWGSENSRIKEITIDVDMKSDEEQGSASEGYHPLESSIKTDNKSKESFSEAENKGVVMPFESSHNKGTYKEVLERGKEEKSQNNENEKGKKKREGKNQKNIDAGESKVIEAEEKDSDEGNRSIKEDDPILQLFDSGWLMKHVT